MWSGFKDLLYRYNNNVCKENPQTLMRQGFEGVFNNYICGKKPKSLAAQGLRVVFSKFIKLFCGLYSNVFVCGKIYVRKNLYEVIKWK